jgi:hypothetical protein
MSGEWEGGPIHVGPDGTELPDGRPPEEWVAEMPADAQRVGLDRTTPEGQLVGFVAGLQGGGRRAKVFAWVVILVFLVPMLVALLADVL